MHRLEFGVGEKQCGEVPQLGEDVSGQCPDGVTLQVQPVQRPGAGE